METTSAVLVILAAAWLLWILVTDWLSSGLAALAIFITAVIKSLRQKQGP